MHGASAGWVVWGLICALLLSMLGSLPGPQRDPRHVHRQASHAAGPQWWPAEVRGLQRWLAQRRQQAQLNGLFSAHRAVAVHDDGAIGHSHAVAQRHAHAWDDGSVLAIDDSGDEGTASQTTGASMLERLLGAAGDVTAALRQDLSQPPPAGTAPPVATAPMKRLERPPRG